MHLSMLKWVKYRRYFLFSHQEPEPPQPPHNIQVELVNYERLDYQVSWNPPFPLSRKTPRTGAVATMPGGFSHPSISDQSASPSATFTRYRVLWAPRKEEPVEASMYNDAAGFSPILDFQNSDVRVLDKVSLLHCIICRANCLSQQA